LSGEPLLINKEVEDYFETSGLEIISQLENQIIQQDAEEIIEEEVIKK
jgi:hypothetical protein